MGFVRKKINTRTDQYSVVDHSKGIDFHLIQASFMSHKFARKFPVLMAFHRLIDGALIGLVLVVVTMSTIALHAQHLWTVSFSKLEASRDLNRRLLESSTIIESHLLDGKTLPNFMVATTAKDLIYLNKPSKDRYPILNSPKRFNFLRRLFSGPIMHGY